MQIPIGSGYIYAVPYSGAIPADSVIEVEANRLGYVEKGASVEYKPTYLTAKTVIGTSTIVLTDETVTLKLGLIAWEYGNLAALCETARVTEAGGIRTVKIGGLGNEGTQYLFRFVHPDVELGDVRITVAGPNTGGFTLSYKPDDAASLEPEITAVSLDDSGTLLIFTEQIPA